MLNAVLCILLSTPLASALAEFFEPGAPPYPRWTVGETQEIRYKTTYTEYTIAIWQQFDDDDAAELGPILFQTSKGPGQDFDWLVQTYDFNLDRSDKFFLWLYEGETSAQGNGTFENQSSGFFYISEASTTTSSALPSTTSGGSVSTTSPEPTTTSNAAEESQDTDGGELSTGAKAGIGAGAGVGALAIIAAIVLFFRYRSKKKKEISELQSAHNQWSTGEPSWGSMSKPAFPPTHAAPLPSYELPGHGDYNRERAELG